MHTVNFRIANYILYNILTFKMKLHCVRTYKNENKLNCEEKCVWKICDKYFSCSSCLR